MNIGENIKAYRKEKKLTQTALASLISKSESTIQKYESGAVVPDINTLIKIASALGVELSLLLQGSSYTNLTSMDKEVADMLAPTETLSEYVEAFKLLGYTVIDHVGKYFSGEPVKGTIYDIIYDNKLVISVDLLGFCALGKEIIKYRRTFERSLRLLVSDTISSWDIIYRVTETKDEEE